MKNFFLFLILLSFGCPLAAFQISDSSAMREELNKSSAFSAAFFYVNDNYIATWWPDYNDQYFGADDFITVSFLSRVYWDKWKFSATFNSITQRKYNLRYDLLTLLLSKKIRVEDYPISLGGGLLYKGNLGGETLQNEVHRLGDVKQVKMPYSAEKGFALILNTSVKLIYKPAIFARDTFSPFMELRISSHYIPSRISAGVSYQLTFYDHFQMELLSAYRFYLNSQQEYSQLVRPGFMNGINLKINVYKDYYIDVGFVTLPTRNILTDAVYDPYKNDYLPQAWISFSWASSGQSLFEHMDY